MYNPCEGKEFGDWSHPDADGGDDRLCSGCRAKMVEANANLPTSWELYAGDRGDHFAHFYPAPVLVTMCGDDSIVLVRLTLDEEGPYWGWLNNHHPSNRSSQGVVSMIYRSKTMVSICFAYGPEAETKRGRGRIVRLKADKIRDVDKSEKVPR